VGIPRITPRADALLPFRDHSAVKASAAALPWVVQMIR
jgi:hypothetical protein